MSRLTLTLLGPPRIELDGEPVHVGRRKSVALLAYLALSHAPQSRDALATLLWPGYDQSHARGHLRRALTTLTSKLGGAWFAADQDTVSLAPIASPCYSPEPVEGAAGRAGSRLWLDVAQFRRLLADCDAHEHPSDAACPECQALLTEAVELYQDDVLAGFSLPDSPAFDEWQRYQTQRLRDELAGALERLSRCLAAQDEYDQAIAHGRRWLKLDPLHEPAHRGLMALYAQAGRRPEALRQYRECLRVLEAELGVPPSAETAALYERLREAQVTPLEKGGPAPAPSPAQLPAFLQQAQDIILSLPKEGILSYKTPTVAERPVFVAREAELAWLAGHLETALAGQSRVVFVTGGPGRGKTALMSHFARQALAAHPDLLVASGACNAYAGVGDPYLPFRETLAMLSGDVETRWAAGTISRAHARRLWAALPLVVQALLDHGPHVIDALLAGSALLSRVETFQTFSDSESLKVSELREWVERDKAHSDLEQAALFQQFTNVLLALAAQHPLLLTLDDLQWADDGSIGVLFHLGRRLEGSRVLIIGAYRPEEVAAGRGGERHPLEKVVAEIQRDFGDVSLDLSRVDETEGRGFVEALLDREPNRLGRAYRETLHRHTGGHPLFTVELLHAMQARGNLVRDHEGQWVEGPNLDWGTLPARVEAVITERVGRLSHDLRDLLAVASVEGERFSAQVVAQVQGVPERKVLRGLMELSTRHRLVRESEALQVAGTGRFVFRYQFAHALFREYLYHSLSAGERMLLHGEIGTALEGLYGDAADEIATTLAHHYDQAGIRERAAVYTLRAGDRARRAYANDEAIVHYQRVLELLGPAAELRGSQDEAEWRLAALTGLGRVHFEGGNLADAERDLRQAIALGKEIDLAPRALVRIYFRLNLVLLWQGRIDELISLSEEGLAHLARETSKGEMKASSGSLESPEAAMMYASLFWAHRRKGDSTQSIKFAEQVRMLAPLLPHTPEFRGMFVLLATAFRDKDIERGMQWLRVLEEIASFQRHPDTSAAARYYTAHLQLRAGDLRAAAADFQDALDVYTGIGNSKNVGVSLCTIGFVLLESGEIDAARKRLSQGLQHLQATGSEGELPAIYLYTGIAALCQGEWGTAADAFSRSLQIASKIGVVWLKPFLLLGLGRTFILQGKQDQGVNSFEKALALEPNVGQYFGSAYPVAAHALSSLERAFDDLEGFRAFCHSIREEHPEKGDWGIESWYLEPAKPSDWRHNLVSDPLSSEWAWDDPFGDCSYCVASRGASGVDAVASGLEIRAANGRDLWHTNLSAPRLLRPAPARRHWAVQTVCMPVSEKKPAIGGLLLWRDKENCLRLDVGTRGADEISFQGCFENEDVIIGRGRLQGSAPEGEQGSAPRGPVWLRLEREGDTVIALCSTDGEDWNTAGSVDFPFEGESTAQVGLQAIGAIDRSIYHGAYPDGTAIRFESFEVWGM